MKGKSILSATKRFEQVMSGVRNVYNVSQWNKENVFILFASFITQLMCKYG